MIDVGGANLPKSISVSLGAKLGKLLKKRGVTGLENSLQQIYTVINAKTKIKPIDDNTREVTLKHGSNFCPLGGKYNPERAHLIQDTICIPYTKSMLKSLELDTKYKIEITDCILKTNDKICQYRLRIKE